MKLYPHQEEAVEFLAARKAAGLFDDQGLGKTATALRAAERVGARRVLVVCPASVTLNWRREATRWAPSLVDDLRVVTKDSLRNAGTLAELTSGRWDVCIVDEAHFFKSHKAKRTKALYGKPSGVSGRIEPCVRRACDRVWILTGTPMPNDPTELWVHLRALAPETIIGKHSRPMGYYEFRDRYCICNATPYGVKVVGVRNAGELRDRLAGFYLRRMKGDVLDLPPIRWTTQPVTTAGIEIDIDVPTKPDGTPDLEALRQMEEFSTWRRACAIAKAVPAAELLLDELAEGTHKEVVFFHHQEVGDALSAMLAGYGGQGIGHVMITGSSTPDARQRAVDAFQNYPDCRVALCNIVAGGTGTTLTAAHRVTFVELSFVPGENAQAADRCHRIGQKESVLVRALYTAGSVDENIIEALRAKTAMIKEVIQ